jgi:hypothetical protein
MGRAFLRVFPVLLASLYASGMGIFWATARLASPGSPPALGDPGAYITAGLLGVAVLVSLGAQERRIRELEQRLQGRDGRAEPGAAPDRGGMS